MSMKSRRIVPALVAVLMLGASIAVADEPLAVGASRHEADIALNMLQSSYSRNWNGGDKGSINWSIAFAGRHEKQISEKFNWTNSLKLAYGQNHQQVRGRRRPALLVAPDNNTDAVEFESMGRLTDASGCGSLCGARVLVAVPRSERCGGPRAESQSAELRESAGISRQLISSDDRSLSVRAGLALVQSSRKFFSEPAPVATTMSQTAYTSAAELVTEYRSKLLDGRVGWESKLTVERPLTWSGKSAFEDGFTSTVAMPDGIAGYTTALDLDWENTLSANITKVISVKFFARWVYDKYDNSVKPAVGDDGVLLNEADVLNAIRKAGQFKQTLALGFGYKF